jgi:hypothetical protein
MSDIKILLIGPCGTGKSKFLQTATGRHKHQNYYYVPTIGVDVFMVNNNRNSFLIWDCSGHKRYDFMIKQYVNSCNAVVYFTDEVFDANLIDFLSTTNLPKFAIFTKVIPNPSLFFGWSVINGVDKKETQIMTELLSYFKNHTDDFIELEIRPEQKPKKRLFDRIRCCFKRTESYSSFRQLQ